MNALRLRYTDMVELIKMLNEEAPGWRDTISPDPIVAALELCLIDPEDLDDYGRELDFDDE